MTAAIQADGCGTPGEPAAVRLDSLELLNHLAYMERRWLCWGELPGVVDTPGNRTTGRRGGSAPVLR